MSENNPAVWAISNWSRKHAPGLAQFAADNKDSWPQAESDIQMAFQGKWGEVSPDVLFPFSNNGDYIEPKELVVQTKSNETEDEDDLPDDDTPKVRLWTCDRKCFGDSGKIYRPGEQITTMHPPSDYFKDEDGNRREGAAPKMVAANKQGRKINHPLIKTPKKAASPADIDAINEMSRNNAEPDIIAKTLNIDPELVLAIVESQK